jgi:hypothetical protein
MLDVCKGKRLQQLQHESYLGPVHFEDDLCRLCAEFYLRLTQEALSSFISTAITTF